MFCTCFILFCSTNATSVTRLTLECRQDPSEPCLRNAPPLHINRGLWIVAQKPPQQGPQSGPSGTCTALALHDVPSTSRVSRVSHARLHIIVTRHSTHKHATANAKWGKDSHCANKSSGVWDEPL